MKSFGLCHEIIWPVIFKVIWPVPRFAFVPKWTKIQAEKMAKTTGASEAL